MVTNEELECVVCCYEYSRSDRVPRVLHCGHTFCASCLEKISKTEGIIRSVSCPLCRWITCTQARLTLPGALTVNTDIWDQIAKEQHVKKQEPDFKATPQLIKSTIPDSRRAGFKSLRKMFSCVVLQERELDGC